MKETEELTSVLKNLLSKLEEPINNDDSSFIGRLKGFNEISNKSSLGANPGKLSKLGNLSKSNAYVQIAKQLYDIAKPLSEKASLAEQSIFEFEQLVGNQAGESLFYGIQNLSSQSVFTTSQLNKNAKTLLENGIAHSKLYDILTKLGQVSFGSVDKMDKLTSVFGTISSEGKLTEETLKELKSHGFEPLKYISKEIGVEIDKLKEKVKEGKISFSDISMALDASTDAGGKFYRGMDEALNTTQGATTRLKNQWDIITNALQTSVGKAVNENIVNPIAEIASWTLEPFVDFIAPQDVARQFPQFEKDFNREDKLIASLISSTKNLENRTEALSAGEQKKLNSNIYQLKTITGAYFDLLDPSSGKVDYDRIDEYRKWRKEELSEKREDASNALSKEYKRLMPTGTDNARILNDPMRNFSFEHYLSNPPDELESLNKLSEKINGYSQKATEMMSLDDLFGEDIGQPSAEADFGKRDLADNPLNAVGLPDYVIPQSDYFILPDHYPNGIEGLVNEHLKQTPIESFEGFGEDESSNIISPLISPDQKDLADKTENDPGLIYSPEASGLNLPFEDGSLISPDQKEFVDQKGTDLILNSDINKITSGGSNNVTITINGPKFAEEVHMHPETMEVGMEEAGEMFLENMNRLLAGGLFTNNR